MPFTLETVLITPRIPGYYVINKNTGKRFSKKPLTLETARKQLYVLRSHAPDGGYMVEPYDEELHGGNFLNAFKFGAEKAANFVQSIPGRLAAVYGLNTTRLDYRPQDRELIKKYGNEKITHVQVLRTPIVSVIDKAMNFLSLGKFNEIKKKYGYDAFFHLYMILTLQNGTRIRLEKHDVITMTIVFENAPAFLKSNAEPRLEEMTEDPKSQPNTDVYDIHHVSNVTFNEFLDNTLKYMGKDKMFIYDGVDNNCQVFVKSCLEANNMMTSDLHKFIMQDASEVPFFTKYISKKVTDLAHRSDIVIHGRAMY